MKLAVEVDEKTLRQLVLEHLEAKLGNVDLSADDVRIETRSKQNYRSEWESADFRARVEKVDA